MRIQDLLELENREQLADIVQLPSPSYAMPYTRISKFLPIGAGGTWDSTLAIPENVIKIGDTYHCCYQGFNGTAFGVGIISSTDLTTWTKSANNPIIANISNASPHLFYDDVSNKYYIIASKAPNINLYRCDTFDGVYTDLGAILTPSVGMWDSNRVLEPFVIKRDGTYYLFYMGDTTNTDPHQEQIGLATATSIEGTWLKSTNNPVLPMNTDSTAWDSLLTADPWIFPTNGNPHTDGYYYMGYAGGGYGGLGGGSYEWKTGIARSTTLNGFWERCPSNPITESKPYIYGATFQDSARIWRGAMFSDGADNWIVYGSASSQQGVLSEGTLALIHTFPPSYKKPLMKWHNLPVITTDKRVVKTGTWVSTPALNAYNGVNMYYSVTTNDTIKITFYGAGIRVKGRASNVYGIAGFVLDGGSEKMVDCYSPVMADGTMLYIAEGLSCSEHTLTIRVTNTKNASAGGVYIAIDLFQILY